MAKPFSEVIAITSTSQRNVYVTAHPLEKEWAVGEVPNGGYTASLFASAAGTHSATSAKLDIKSYLASQPHVLHLSLQYLRRVHADHRATFKVRDVKLGRRQSVVHLTLTQPEVPDEGETSLVEGYVTLGNLGTEEGISFKTGRGFLSPRPLPVDLRRLEGKGEDLYWRVMKERPFVDFRRSSQHIRKSVPKSPSEEVRQGSQLTREMTSTDLAKHAGSLDPSGAVKAGGSSMPADIGVEAESDEWSGVVDEWVQFTPYSRLDSTSKPARWTNATLPYLVDNFMPPVEQISRQQMTGTPKFWYPTLTLTLDVKRLLPEAGADWLFLRCRPKVIQNGRMDLDVIIMDEQGDIVATAIHSALVLDISRNTGGRRKPKDQGGKL